MSTLFFFGENLSLYLSWLRTNAGPVPDAPARGEPGQGKVPVAGVDTSCFASAPFPVAGVDVLSLRESRPCSGGGRHVLLRKPYRVAAATPVAKNSPQDCFLNAPAFGSTPESNNNQKEEQSSCEPCSSFWCRWRGSMCFRFAKPLRAAAAAPAPANMPLACLLDGAAQGFDPLTYHRIKERPDRENLSGLSWCRWRGSNPHGVTTNGF